MLYDVCCSARIQCTSASAVWARHAGAQVAVHPQPLSNRPVRVGGPYAAGRSHKPQHHANSNHLTQALLHPVALTQHLAFPDYYAYSTWLPDHTHGASSVWHVNGVSTPPPPGRKPVVGQAPRASARAPPKTGWLRPCVRYCLRQLACHGRPCAEPLLASASCDRWPHAPRPRRKPSHWRRFPGDGARAQQGSARVPGCCGWAEVASLRTPRLLAGAAAARRGRGP